jgi:hypothetical protein
MTEEKEERKNTAWTYSTLTHMLVANFPEKEYKLDGKMVKEAARSTEYNLTVLVKGMTNTQELGFMYGVKQWLSSNGASFKSTAGKITSYAGDFKGLCEHGLELAGEGKIRVTGTGSKSSEEKAENARIVAEVKQLRASFTRHSDVEKLKAMKLLNIALTPEQEEMLKNVKK